MIYIYIHIDIWYIYIHLDIWYIYMCVCMIFIYIYIYVCVCARTMITPHYSSLVFLNQQQDTYGLCLYKLYSTYGTYMLLVPFMFLRFQSFFSAQRSCATHLPWPHTFPVPSGPFRWPRPPLPTNFWCPTGCLPSDFGYAMPARVSRCLGMSWMGPVITLSSDPRVLVAYL